jgi:predicted Zn-dependent protease
MPFAEWQQKLANDQSVSAARMLATSSTPAALRLAVEDRKRNDPDWGVNVGDDLCLELISILIPERSWALVDDLLAYAARRSHAIEPQVRFELLSAYSQAARGMGGRERLQEWAESGDDRLGGKASWVRPWADWVLASASAANGDRDDALIRFRRLYKEWPWDPEPLYAVLTMLDDKKDTEAVSLLVHRIQQLDWRPMSTAIAVDRLSSCGKLEEAKAASDEGKKRWPEEDSLRISQALLSEATGKTDDAVQTLKSLIGGPHSEEAGARAWQLMEGKYSREDMLAFAAQWQKEGPSQSAYILPVTWLATRQELEAALEMMERGQAAFGRNAPFAAAHASVLMRMGRRNEAKRVATVAADAHPESEMIWVLLARIALDGEQWDECAAASAMALKNDRRNESALVLLATASQHLGDRRAFDTAVSSLRDINPRAAEELRRLWPDG